MVHFVPTILFVLTLASDMVVWNGSYAFSILLLPTEKPYYSFLENVFVLQKIVFKVKLLKTFKFSTDFHIETYRFLKRRAILKIPTSIF